MMIRSHAERDRDVTPFDEDMTDYFRETAYEYHDTLVKMGGRPTRSVLEKPAGKAVYRGEKGIIEILDEHGKLTCTLGHEICPIHYHWTEEFSRFEEELDRWRKFRDYQQSNPQLSPLSTVLNLSEADRSLQAILIQLNEWQNFEAYHQSAVNTALMSTWRIRQNLEKLFEEEARSGRAASNPEVQSNISTWLERLFPRQKDLDSSQKQLTIIESQAFEIISEACASFEDTPLLCQQLEKKLEEQTNAVYQDLVLLGARPTCAAQASSPTAPYIQRILHWKSETSRLLKERREWRMFLKWRKNQANANMLVATEGNQSNGRYMDSVLWRDYVTYRQTQVNKANSWIICWQRLKRSSEKQVEQLTKAGLLCFGGSAASIQRYVERFQEDVRTAEARLRSA